MERARVQRVPQERLIPLEVLQERALVRLVRELATREKQRLLQAQVARLREQRAPSRRRQSRLNVSGQ